MANALLTYSGSPDTVALSSAGAPNDVSITVTITNRTTATVNVASIALTVPRGTGATDLIEPGTSVNTGNVHSSNGTAWSPSTSDNQVMLTPVNPSGYAALAPNDALTIALTGLQITTAGAHQRATIAVSESIYDGATGTAGISIQKLGAGVQIVAFYADVYNVDANDSVTITWKVLQAESCSVTTEIQNVAARTSADDPPGNRVLSNGTDDFDDAVPCAMAGATLITLTATGKSEGQDVTITSQFLVTVNDPAINFTVFPPQVSLGVPVELTWIAANAGNLVLYGVPSPSEFQSPKTLTATPSGSMSLVPLQDTTYTLYAFRRAGDSQPAHQIGQAVSVSQPAWVTAPAVSKLPSPAYPGDSFTLAWNVDNVASCVLTCDVPGFTPVSGLPANGSTTVTIPDPGVSQQTATFTLTPVKYGTLGNFTPQTVQIQIQNTPNFSIGLTPSASNGGAGASVTLSWAVDHTDGTGTLNSDFAGASAITVDPASGAQAVQLPDVVIPTVVHYTLDVSRQSGRYPASSAAQVTMNGNIGSLWCTGPYTKNSGSNYLAGLYDRFPNQRITRVGAEADAWNGITGLYVWYSQNGAPDYAIKSLQATGAPQQTLPLAKGETIVSMDTQLDFYYNEDLGADVSVLMWLSLGTSAGNRLSIGPQQGDTRCSQAAPPGTMAIAFGWNIQTWVTNYMDAIGMMYCASSYGA